jgi:hypothetical protein
MAGRRTAPGRTWVSGGDEDGDGLQERQQRHREFPGVTDPQVAAHRADDVGDETDRGGDAGRCEPQADEDADGSGDLEPRQKGQMTAGKTVTTTRAMTTSLLSGSGDGVVARDGVQLPPSALRTWGRTSVPSSSMAVR